MPSLRRLTWKTVPVVLAVLLVVWWLTAPHVRRTRVLSGVESAWVSPDGSYVAWTEASDDSTTLVRKMETGSTTRFPGQSLIKAPWSADGRYLLLRRGDSGPGVMHDLQAGSEAQFPLDWQVKWAATGPWFAEGSTRQPYRLRRADQPEQEVPLFPAGIRAVLAVNGEGPSIGAYATGELYVHDRLGSDSTILPPGKGIVQASPDGACWALPTAHSLHFSCNGRTHTYTYESIDDPSGYFFWSGSWSPDHQWFVLIGRTRDAGYDLRIFTADGTQKAFRPGLFRGYPQPESFWWSPGSRQFAMITRESDWIQQIVAFRLFEIPTGKQRTWRESWFGIGALEQVTWVDEHTVYAQADDRLVRFELR